MTFSVTAAGTAPLGYQWRFSSVDLLAKTSSSLALTNVQMANAGDYSVVVSNAAGMITSTVATLTVPRVVRVGNYADVDAGKKQ